MERWEIEVDGDVLARLKELKNSGRYKTKREILRAALRELLKKEANGE